MIPKSGIRSCAILKLLAEIERRRRVRKLQFELLVGVDRRRFADPIGNRAGPENQDQHQDELQDHPGHGAPIDLCALDRGWRDPAQIKQGVAERWMHEARLHIRADQNTEPDEIDPELGGDWRQEWNDDESDLEEIQEEGDDEDEE